MNKEQQIKEFQNDIIDNLFNGDTYKLAEDLYNAGYRKIDGENYISKEWHGEQVLHGKIERLEEAEAERLRTKLAKVLLTIDTVKEMNAMCNIDLQIKQAVKEFAEKLKEKYKVYEDRHICYRLIDDLLKEYEE